MRATAEDGMPLATDVSVQQQLARLAIDEEVSRLLAMRVRWIAQTGGMSGVEGSMSKLFSSEAEQRRTGALMDLLGSAAVLQDGIGPLHSEVEQAFRKSPVGTIYGGASEIQREIVAEQRLCLPRSRPAG